MEPELSESKTPSLADVFEQHESELLHFAYGYVKRRPVAEELVQESFLRLHKQWKVVQNPRAWLYRCVRNLSLNHLRTHRRETVIPLPDEGSPADDHKPDAELLRIEAFGMVRELIADLPERDRRLIHLKYHEDQSYKDIAETLEMGIGNVGYRLHHILKRLGTALSQAGIASPSE